MDAYTLNIYKQGKVKLDIILNNYCNLNCSACMFGANTNKIPRQVYNLDQFKKDIAYLSQFKDVMTEFNFLGGEPTLNKDLITYLNIVHSTFPSATLNLITNGIKLVNNTELLNIIKELNITVLLSIYPKTIKMGLALRTLFNSLGINHGTVVAKHSKEIKTVWSAPLTSTVPINKGDLKALKYNCSYGCLAIWNGKFIACGIQFSIPMRNALFGTNYKEEGLPIESIKTKEDLIELQANKWIPEICKYCYPGTGEIVWIPHTTNSIDKKDYIL